MNWPLLLNSLLVAALSALAGTGIGFIAALWLAGLSGRWRNFLVAAAMVALAMPPFLASSCWIDLLGNTGAWRAWLPLNIYSLGGAAWILALQSWPITLLLVLGAWGQLDPGHLEADPALRGTALIRWLLWPLAKAAAAHALVVTFVLALNNFAVPSILQVKVFPAEVWIRFSTNLNPAEAAATGWPLLAGPVLLLLLLRGAQIRWPSHGAPACATMLRRQLGAGWNGLSATVTSAALLLSVVLPLARMLVTPQTWTELPALLQASQGTIWNSFSFAALTATVCLALVLAGWRLRIGLLLWFPFLVPGVLVGVGLIQVFNRPSLGALYGSLAMVIIALGVRYLAPAWNVVAHSLRSTDRNLSDTARLDGAGPMMFLRHVYWPQVGTRAAGAWYLTYLLCLWDVETLLLVHPPGGETLALRIYNLLHYGHSAQVDALSLALLALAVAPLGLASLARRSFRRRRMTNSHTR